LHIAGNICMLQGSSVYLRLFFCSGLGGAEKCLYFYPTNVDRYGQMMNKMRIRGEKPQDLPEGKFESEMKGFCRQFFFHPIIFLAGLSLIPFLVISFDLALYYPFLLSFLPFKACFSNHSSSNTFR